MNTAHLTCRRGGPLFVLLAVWLLACAPLTAQCVRPELIMIKPCIEHDNPNGSGLPVQGEFIILRTGAAPVPTNTIGVDVPFNGFGAVNADLGYDTDGILQGCDYGPPRIDSLPGCDQTIPLGPDDVVPPNATVVVFITATTTTEDLSMTDFANICDDGAPVYVLQSACERTAGAFADGPGQGDPLRSVIVSSPCGLTSSTYNTTDLDPDNGTYFLVRTALPGNLDCNLPVLPPTCPVFDTTFLLCGNDATPADPFPASRFRSVLPASVLLASFHPTEVAATLNEDRITNYIFPDRGPDTLYSRVLQSGDLCQSVGLFIVDRRPPVQQSCIVEAGANPGVANGAFTVLVQGGVPPYEINYSGADAGVRVGTDSRVEVMGVPAGDYTVTVTDAEGCLGQACTLAVPLNEDVELDCRVRNDAGPGLRGSVAVVVNSGTPPFLIELIRPNGNVSTYADRPLGEWRVGNLVAGDYTFRVTDANGRQASCDLTVNNVPCPLTIDRVSLLEISCMASNGTVIRLGIAGNSGPVTTTWSGPNNVAQFNGMGEAGPLPPGTYSVSVADASACSAVNSGPIVVSAPSPVGFNVDGNFRTSPCRTDATLEVFDLAGGRPPYRIDLFDRADGRPLGTRLGAAGPDTVGFGGLGPAAGTQTVGVFLTDASGCFSDTLFLDLTATPGPDLRLAAADQTLIAPTCTGNADGSFSLQASGDQEPYAYRYLSTPPLAPGRQLTSEREQTDLPAGDYLVEITSAGGCVDTALITLPTPAPPPSLDCTATAAPPAGTGSLMLSPANGVAPYRLVVVGPVDTVLTDMPPAPRTLTGLPPGTYTTTVTDANGCAGPPCTATIVEAACPLSLTFTVDTTACPGQPWTITANGAGGSPLTYDWVADSLPDAASVTVFGPGTYALQLSGSGCALDTALTLLPGNRRPLSYSLPTGPLIGCGEDSLTIPLVVSGAANYKVTYRLLATDSTTVRATSVPVDEVRSPWRIETANLPVGSYRLVVDNVSRDGCDSRLAAGIAIEISQTDTVRRFGEVCVPTVDVGGRTFTATAPTDTFLVDNNRCGTVYEVDLRFNPAPTTAPDTLELPVCLEGEFELNGEVFSAARPEGEVFFARPGACDSVVYVRLLVPEPRFGAYGENRCVGDTVFYGGRVFTEANPSGLVELPGQGFRGCDSLVVVTNTFRRTGDVRLFGDFSICPGDSIDLRFTYDGPGSIDVTATDAAGLTYDFPNVGNNDRRRLFPTGSTTYTLRSARAGNCPGTVAGAASVVVSDLRLSLAVPLDPADFCHDTLGALRADPAGGLPPYRFAWSNGGEDSLQVNLPVGTYSVTATDAIGCALTDSFALRQAPTIEATLTGLPPDCPGEPGRVRAEDLSGGAGGYEISQDGQSFSPLSELGNLDFSVGNHQVFVQDANDCQATFTVFVPPAEPLGTRLPTDTTILLGDSVLLDPGPLPQLDTFSWTPTTALRTPAEPTTVAAPLRSTEYYFSLVTAAGCTLRQRVRVAVDRRLPVYAPTAFSPDGNTVNDLYRLALGSSARSVKAFRVYNRWGTLVYDGTEGWDGTLAGRAAPPAVYVFRAVIEMADGSERTMSGDFVLMR